MIDVLRSIKSGSLRKAYFCRLSPDANLVGDFQQLVILSLIKQSGDIYRVANNSTEQWLAFATLVNPTGKVLTKKMERKFR